MRSTKYLIFSTISLVSAVSLTVLTFVPGFAVSEVIGEKALLISAVIGQISLFGLYFFLNFLYNKMKDKEAINDWKLQMKNKFGAYVQRLMTTVLDEEQEQFVKDLAWSELNRINADIEQLLRKNSKDDVEESTETIKTLLQEDKDVKNK